ncbi:MAG: recombinase family protein [Mesorhizobium sp.]
MAQHDLPKAIDINASWFGPPDRDQHEIALAAARQGRAVTYHRFSKMTESPDSIARQNEVTRPYVSSRKLDLVQAYDEPKASGAYMDNRDVLLRLLDDVDRLNIGHVVVESTDRLGRGIAVLGEIWGQLESKGVTIHDASAGVPIDSIRFAVSAGMAEADRKRIIRILESGRDTAAKKGKPIMGRCLGYRFELDDASRRVRVIDESEARTVQEIFRLFLSGVSPAAIARMLNEEVPGGRHGKKWSASHIRGSRIRPGGILRRLRYTGVQTFRQSYTTRKEGGTRTPPRWRSTDAWILSPVIPELQIITPEMFVATQQKLAEGDREYADRRTEGRKRNQYWGKRGTRLLSGVMHCGHCGAPMFMRSYKNEGKSFRCGDTDKGRSRCRPSSIVMHWVENAVAELLGAELSDWKHTKSFVEQYNKAADTRLAQEAKSRGEVEKRLERLNFEFDATFDTAMMAGFTDQWVVQKRQALSKEEESLRETLARLDAGAPGPARLKADGIHVVRDALGHLIQGGPIDTSRREGVGLVAAFRSLVCKVVAKVVPSGELEVGVELSPSAVLSNGPTDLRRIVLSGRFRRPRRGAPRRRRLQTEWETLAVTGAHRRADSDWQAIRRLVPKSFSGGGGERVGARQTVEAALFHLRNGVPRTRLPTVFGNRKAIAAAVKRLGIGGWWRAVEPELRRVRPDLLEGVLGSKLLPVGRSVAAGAVARLTPLQGFRSGAHRLTDDEWLLIEHALPPDELKAAGVQSVAPRALVDVVMFLAKEGLSPNYLPKRFGRREELERGVYWLLRQGRWGRIADILRRDSPRTLDGACFQLLERYFTSSRCFKLGGRLVKAEAMAVILGEIEAEVARGVPTRLATSRAGVPYQSYLRFRTNPLLRSLVGRR